jgi:dTDP-4-amino-4,6-dideoxygalactose transaminase
MKVPMADLAAQHAEVATEITGAVDRVLASGRYILGEDVAAFEREMEIDANERHAIGVSSGTDALIAALWALGVGPGDEVVTTSFSFFATAGAIARLGATPVFADIESTLNLDPQSALARVTAKTKAIVPVHLFGRPADTAALAEAGVPIIEDAAQAIGAPLGRIATLSFFPTKNLGAAGDAGMVVTDEDSIAERVRLFRTHGAREKNVHVALGTNARMDTLQAAILRVKRRYLAAWTARRRANARAYLEALADLPLVLPEDVPDHVWHHFVVRTTERDRLQTFLRANEIESDVYYPIPLHRQPCFAVRESLPEAERAASEVLALPVHPQLSTEQRQHVIDSMRGYFSNRG